MLEVTRYQAHLACVTIAEIAHAISYALGANEITEDTFIEVARLRGELVVLASGLHSVLSESGAMRGHVPVAHV